MTDTFRAMCAELIDAWDKHGGNWLPAHEEAWFAAIDRARAALAEAYEAEANNPPEGHPDPGPFQAMLRERAAALRAAAPLMECVQDHLKLLAIAAELEGSND
jgi:hypothetical protein